MSSSGIRDVRSIVDSSVGTAMLCRKSRSSGVRGSGRDNFFWSLANASSNCQEMGENGCYLNASIIIVGNHLRCLAKGGRYVGGGTIVLVGRHTCLQIAFTASRKNQLDSIYISTDKRKTAKAGNMVISAICCSPER